MKEEISRRSFLSILGLATACAIIESPLKLVSVPDKVYKVRYLKVTQEMMYDTKMLKYFIQNEGLKLSNNDPHWEKNTSIQIGFEADDFERNLKTIVLTYNK